MWRHYRFYHLFIRGRGWHQYSSLISICQILWLWCSDGRIADGSQGACNQTLCIVAGMEGIDVGCVDPADCIGQPLHGKDEIKKLLQGVV